MVGLPASGKSTFAYALQKYFIKRFTTKKVSIVDIDVIRENLTGKVFNPNREKEARQKNLDTIFKLLKKDKIVISDDLNYYSSMRHDLKAIADKLGLPFFTIHIATPVNKCIEWNEKRHEKIPSDLIRAINEKFDAFEKYGWDDPLEIIDLSKINDMNEEIKKIVEKIIFRLEESKSNRTKNQNDRSQNNERKELLDKTTRKIVSDLLKKPDYQPFKTEIIKLRKIFVREQAKEYENVAEIELTFKSFLESALNLEKR
ncbi:MAG: AAA family ATPase [Promethearchaeota archaeon]